MKLSNGEVVVIDDLIPLQQQINLYVEACSLPYRLVGSNKYDIQDIKPPENPPTKTPIMVASP